jgi:hypothetical protein
MTPKVGKLTSAAVVAAAFLGTVFADAQLHADDKPAIALETVSIDPRNEFRQVTLDVPTIEKVLAALPSIMAMTRENSEKTLAASRSGKPLWDNMVSITAQSQEFHRREAEAARKAGFASADDYYDAHWTLWLAVAPAEVRGIGQRSAEYLALLKEGDFVTRMVAAGSIASLERTISLARQQPLAGNAAKAAPYREAFLKAANEMAGKE